MKPPPRKPRRVRQLLRRAALALAGAVALYFLAAVVLSAIPLNRDAGRSGPIEIFVRSNGMHVDLVLPVRNERFDWGPVAPASDAADPRAAAAPWVAIGWGDRDVYRKVPTWSDLTPGLALRAGLGLDGAALHAVRLFIVEEGPDCRPLALTDEQYDALVAFLLESGVRDADGRLVPLAGTPGFGATDAFYEARGRYHPFFTCNTWCNLALKRAGLPCCVWTPFASPILHAVGAEMESHAENAENAKFDSHAERAESAKPIPHAESAELKSHAESAENAEGNSAASHAPRLASDSVDESHAEDAENLAFLAIGIAKDNVGETLGFQQAPPEGWPPAFKTEYLLFASVPTGSSNLWVSVFETTNAQWENIRESPSPSFFTNSVWKETRPVESVNADQIENRFLPVLNGKLDGWRFRLPTEAEWNLFSQDLASQVPDPSQERCNDGSLDTGYWDMDKSLLGILFEYNDAKKTRYYRNCPPSKSGPAAVGCYPPNRYGLHDLRGNVAEWCAPPDSFAPVRGGCWLYLPEHCLVETRAFIPKDMTHHTKCAMGFRLVMDKR